MSRPPGRAGELLVEWSAFRNYLAGLGLSPKTIRIYLYAVAACQTWCRQQGTSIVRASALLLATYAERIPNSTASRRQLRTALQHYWEWKGIDDRPARAIRVPPKPAMVCKALDPDAAQKMATVAFGWHPEGTATLFGLYLALRREEIASARWDRYHDGWYTVQGKRDVVATLPVHPRLAEQLDNTPRNGDYLFPGSQGREWVHPTTIWLWIRRVAEVADVGIVSPHQLRHTALATANDATGDLRAVSVFARHKRVETTVGYTRTTAHKLQTVVEALDYE